MGSMSAWHWAIVIGVVLLLFGAPGRVSGIMGDFARGIRAFRRGIADDAPAIDSDNQKDV